MNPEAVNFSRYILYESDKAYSRLIGRVGRRLHSFSVEDQSRKCFFFAEYQLPTSSVSSWRSQPLTFHYSLLILGVTSDVAALLRSTLRMFEMVLLLISNFTDLIIRLTWLRKDQRSYHNLWPPNATFGQSRSTESKSGILKDSGKQSASFGFVKNGIRSEYLVSPRNRETSSRFSQLRSLVWQSCYSSITRSFDTSRASRTRRAHGGGRLILFSLLSGMSCSPMLLRQESQSR